jgi:hypothetical protein
MKSVFALDYEPPAVRIASAGRLLRLQATSGKSAQKESLFTLHSASGFKRADGSVEIEKIAGYCHDRGMLRTYWLHRVHAISDAVTGEEIDDLAGWIAAIEARGESGTPDQERQEMTAAAQPVPQPRNAAAAIDDAVRCALEHGDRAIAERLFRIGGLLKHDTRSGPAC